MTTEATTKRKMYNLTGTIETIVPGKTANTGVAACELTLALKSGKKVFVKSYEAVATALTDGFKAGSPVKLFGYYKNRQVAQADGSSRRFSDFVARHAETPKTREEIAALRAAKAARVAEEAAAAA